MDLDEQLAALAAGELPPDEARALRARVAVDPSLQRRLARLERLDVVLRDWTVPAMGADAVDRLDAAVTAALDALPDGPLAERAAGDRARTPLAAVPDDEDDDVAAAPVAATAGAGDGVVDLAAERTRRRGISAWLPQVGVAAVALLVVGVGVGSLLDSTSSEDMATDELALDDGAETEEAEESAEMADESADAMMAEPAEAPPDALVVLEDVAYSGDDLATLAAPVASTTSESDAAGSSESAATTDSADGDGESGRMLAVTPEHTACIDRAIELADGLGEVVLVATGTYEGAEASFVVLRPSDPARPAEVFAFDGACELLGRAVSEG